MNAFKQFEITEGIALSTLIRKLPIPKSDLIKEDATNEKLNFENA